MKYLFLSYYFPPDIGAGAFRSQKFINNFIKEVLLPNDELHVISSSPNRYDKNLNANHNYILNDKRVKNIKIDVYNHKERTILKILSGVKYFFYAIFYVFKIRPNICISTTARTISGLAIYLPSIFLNYQYFIDLRDLFSEVLKDLLPKNFLNKFLIFLLQKLENKIFRSAVSVNFVSPGFGSFFIKKNIVLKETTAFTNGLDDIFIEDNKEILVNSIKKILYVGNIGEGQGLHKLIPEVANNVTYPKLVVMSSLFDVDDVTYLKLMVMSPT